MDKLRLQSHSWSRKGGIRERLEATTYVQWGRGGALVAVAQRGGSPQALVRLRMTKALKDAAEEGLGVGDRLAAPAYPPSTRAAVVVAQC
jgi:hypothetical protein